MRTILVSLTSLISASFFVNMSNAAITTMIGIYVAEIGGEQSDVAAIVALDISGTPLVWAGLRMMMGFAVAVTTAVTDAWINDKTPNDQRGRVIAIYAMVLGIASVMSQMAFFFLDAGSNGFVGCRRIFVRLRARRIHLYRAVLPENSWPRGKPDSVVARHALSRPARVPMAGRAHFRAHFRSV
jgi:MFS family permease